MKSCLFSIFLGVLILAPAVAWSQSQSSSNQGPYAGQQSIQYNRTQRFNRPVDPVIGYRNAENVVTQSMYEEDLPSSVRTEIENAMNTCPGSSVSTSGIKVYSYVSDWLRARGLSPNYVIDFSGVTPNAQCATPFDCNDDGCVIVAYTSYSYGQWRRESPIRAKSWSLDSVNDMRASPIPQLGKPETISVFDFTVKCADDATGDQPCHDYRYWGLGGLSDYTPNASQ